MAPGLSKLRLEAVKTCETIKPIVINQSNRSISAHLRAAAGSRHLAFLIDFENPGNFGWPPVSIVFEPIKSVYFGLTILFI